MAALQFVPFVGPGMNDNKNRITASVAYPCYLTEEGNMRTGYKLTRNEGGDTSGLILFNLQRDSSFGI